MGVLEVKGVNKRFGGLKALDEVNINVEAGTVHAIIGPNGAGKSTLLNCLVGRLEPDTGTVDFDGNSLLNLQPHEINQLGVSRVFQTPEIFSDLDLLENVMIPTLARRDQEQSSRAVLASQQQQREQEHSHVRSRPPMAPARLPRLCGVSGRQT